MCESKGKGPILNTERSKSAEDPRLLRNHLKRHLFPFLECQRKARVRDAGARRTKGRGRCRWGR